MRAGILWKIGVIDDDDSDKAKTPFRKDELKSIAASLQDE